MNRSLERSLHRGVAALAVGATPLVKLLAEPLGKQATPLPSNFGAVMASTRYEPLAPVPFATGLGALPTNDSPAYQKVAFSGFGLGGSTHVRVRVRYARGWGLEG
ncbi:MAG TPA: hypothetical protein VJ827_09025 [Rubrobacter sp.]|nr:hypothetical protein [Rubrobacter sp.]